MPQDAVEIDDAIVLLLGAPTPGQSRSRIEGITRLEKLIFLLQRELAPPWLTEDAEFSSHNFGPFSSKIYTAIDTLSAAGLVTDSKTISGTPEDAWEVEHVIGESATDPYATRNVELTDRGRRYYDALVRELPRGTEHELSSFKAQFSSLPLRQLIRYVYMRYPEFTDRSIIRDDILG